MLLKDAVVSNVAVRNTAGDKGNIAVVPCLLRQGCIEAFETDVTCCRLQHCVELSERHEPRERYDCEKHDSEQCDSKGCRKRVLSILCYR